MTERVCVKIKKISTDAITPKYATNGAAGCDLYSTDDLTLWHGSRVLVGTGICLEIPEGWYAKVCPRSGMAINAGITVLNAPGIIDFDYRGEIKVILYNTSDDRFFIKKGDRIAQLVFSQCNQADFSVVEDLTLTERSGGFGSTGKR